jgi:hypothetical protein
MSASFFWTSWLAGQRAAELDAVQRVLARAVEAVLGSAQSPPGDAVARAVQAGEGALQAAHLGEGVFLGAEHVVHHDLAGDAGAQAHLAVDGRCGQPFQPFSRMKPRICPPSSLAQTTNTSATGLLLIHILLPLSE